MKTQTSTLALLAVFVAGAVAGPAPQPTAAMQARQNDGMAVVDGQTLTPGLNDVDGQTYSYTDGYVIGPTITQGPSLQINPRVTQAFGCQIVNGGAVKQGDCDGVEAKISSALATITGGSGAGGSAAPAPTSSGSSSSDSSDNDSGSNASVGSSGESASSGGSSAHVDGAHSITPGQGLTVLSAVAIGSALALLA